VSFSFNHDNEQPRFGERAHHKINNNTLPLTIFDIILKTPTPHYSLVSAAADSLPMALV